MDFHELLNSRKSIRAFDRNKTIPTKLLERILRAGQLAPSARNQQPWRFHVVQSTSLRQQLCRAYKRDWLQSAPCLLVVSGKRSEAWGRNSDGYNSLETDLTIAMDHMILAAAYEGIGSCWIAAFDPDIVKITLMLDEEEVVFAFTPLGFAAPGEEGKPKQRKELAEIVRYL